jgi:hypothetical protein
MDDDGPVPLWRRVTSTMDPDDLRTLGLWLAGQPPDAVRRELQAVVARAPWRLRAALCVLDTALRAGGPAVRAPVAAWLPDLLAGSAAAWGTDAPGVAAAAAVEALVVTWVTLGWLPASALGIRALLLDRGPAATIACPVCPWARFAHRATAAAHVDAHAGAARHRLALDTRRPSVLRHAAAAAAIAAAAEDRLPRADTSPLPWAPPDGRAGGLVVCAVCGDPMEALADDAVGRVGWWVGGVRTPAGLAHQGCVATP